MVRLRLNIPREDRTTAREIVETMYEDTHSDNGMRGGLKLIIRVPDENDNAFSATITVSYLPGYSCWRMPNAKTLRGLIDANLPKGFKRNAPVDYDFSMFSCNVARYYLTKV